MGLISPQQVSDGSTADASDINTPINTIANEFNGNIDNANIKSAAAIDASKLAAASITNTQFATAVSPVTRADDTGIDWVASGCVWSGDSYGSTRVASMTAGVVYVDGIRATVSAVTSRTFTASKDTYVDIDSTGTITYTEVSNNAASPALTSGNIRVAIIVTGASSIASALSINQGKLSSTSADQYLPNTGATWQSPGGSTINDGEGYLICNRNPNPGLVSGYARTAIATAGSPGATAVAWNGCNYVIFRAVANTNYVFRMAEPALSGMTNNDDMVFEIYLATAANTYTTTKGEQGVLRTSTVNTGALVEIPFNSGSYSGKTFLNIKFRNAGFTGTCNINTDATRTGIYTIERV